MGATTDSSKQQIFGLLVLFRWLTLVPPLLFLIFDSGNSAVQARYLFALILAISVTAAISIFAQPINNNFRKHPWLLGVDILLVSLLLALTGGWHSPYYLFSLTPILAAAFFFQVRGAILAATIFLPFYLAAIFVANSLFTGPDPDWLLVTSAIVGTYLIGSVFGYISLLLNRLQASQERIAQASSNLSVLHALSTALQRSANVLEVQDQVLSAITQNLGFRRAVIGLVDQRQASITNWRVKDKGETAPEWIQGINPIPITHNTDPIIDALVNRRIQIMPRFTSQSAESSLKRFGIGECLAIPMNWGALTIGVILTDLSGKEEDPTQRKSLEAIARQTAATLGMMITRQRRARENAIQEERIRIALDLHDSISQSLFGLVYTLKACVSLLPDQPDEVLPELQWALATAEDVRLRIRATINDMWPSELTAQQFEADLKFYAEDVLQAANLNITFEIRGDFSTLSPPARRAIYRICQEGLSNVIQHAGASESRVCVDVAEGRARFILRDDGRGFDPAIIYSQEPDEDHFGLRGMKERAAALGGTCDIYSQPDEGTSIIIDIPANTQVHHEPASDPPPKSALDGDSE